MENRLFPFALRGGGTADVESFSSYLHRTSFEHGVHVGELLRHACNSDVTCISSCDSSFKLPKYLSVGELVKPSAATINLINIFEELTCQELHSGILWVLDVSIGRSLGEVFSGFRWCPECFSEMESLNEGAYFKLIWHMTAISHCTIHRAPLVSQCSVCGSDQNTYKKKRPINLCQKCGVELSKRGDSLTCDDIGSSWEADGSDIVELFEDVSTISKDSIVTDGVVKSLNHLFDYYWDRDRENEFYELLSRSELLSIIHQQKPISLKTTRRLAFRMGVSIYTLISGNVHQSSAVLDSRWLFVLPTILVAVNNKNKRNHHAVFNKLRKVITKYDRPPSVNEVANCIDVSVGYLNYRFPVIVKSIVKKHQEYEANLMIDKRNRAQEAALKFFIDDKYMSYNKSRKQAYKVLRDETELPKFMLKGAIQKAYTALSVSNQKVCNNQLMK